MIGQTSVKAEEKQRTSTHAGAKVSPENVPARVRLPGIKDIQVKRNRAPLESDPTEIT